MSDDMSEKETATGEDNIKFEMDEASTASATDVAEVKLDGPDDVTTKEPEGPEEFANGAQEASEIPKEEEAFTEDRKSVKRRASVAFSDEEENEFKGFDVVQDSNGTEKYTTLLDRMESELAAALDNYKPLRNVTAVPSSVKSKHTSRPDTDGSRPSSGLSSRSDNDGLAYLTDLSSPGAKGRRLTMDMSSPLLRVPLERGWKRELVYRAALDSHSRRNADIYYYTPQGKKLRSTREVSENISGTGLTLENFSFFKEPLGINDPEKEIIRDAKVLRRVESPVPTAAPPLDGKRTPKPKPPKGVSPEPAAVPSALKIKVKSLGSRLSSGAQSTPPNNKGKRTDNNNTPTWKKPKPAMAPVASGAPGAIGSPGACGVQGSTHLTPATPAHPPPPLQSRPQQHHTSPQEQTTRQLVQPCSMSCGRGAVPSLACVACLCLYHPVCVGHSGHAHTFYCKNCRVSPSVDPPPLTHKSGITVSAVVPPLRPRAIRPPAPAITPPAHTLRAPPPTTPPNKRVLLRMKVSGGGPDGERVWAVTKTPGVAGGASPRSLTLRPCLPQSIAVLGGRRFIVVPRSLVQTSQQPHDENRRRGRVANGASIAPQPSPSAASPGSGASPRRRGRPRTDDTDHFTRFYNTAKENNYNVVLQIFQYLGMRDLAHCARVCKLWQQLAATPSLWRHVRMKNSHVSDWGGLCSALKRNGTKRLDLRKMLLPQNDTVFWEQFAQHIATVDALERIEMCRCPARAVEAVCSGLHGLKSLSALAIRDALLDPAPLGSLSLLHELRLKSMAGLSLTRDLRPLAALKHLQHLSLTSIKELGWCLCDVVGQLEQLESLELGECTFRAEFGNVLTRLTRLRRLRLERGTAHCAAPALLRALSTLPLLTRLELINFDVKVGFDDALASCKNIQRLLIIPTYVSQSATTNKQVLSGVLRLRDTLTHLMWGVTIELLRVTELFIDQCEQGTGPEDPAANDPKRRELGECIPVLKPVPGCRLPDDRRHVTGPPQVEILPLPTLQRLLNAQLPNTKLKLLRIPFHATWRQSLADF